MCAQKQKFPKKCLFFVFLCLKCVNQLKMRQKCFSITRDMVLCLQVKNQTIWWEFCEIKFSRLSYSCRHFFVGTGMFLFHFFLGSPCFFQDTGFFLLVMNKSNWDFAHCCFSLFCSIVNFVPFCWIINFGPVLLIYQFWSGL